MLTPRLSGLAGLMCLVMFLGACGDSGGSATGGDEPVDASAAGDEDAVTPDAAADPEEDAAVDPEEDVAADPEDDAGPDDPACADGEVDCGGTCIDPLSSVEHCGASGDCTGDDAGFSCAAGEACVDGTCSSGCEADQVQCGGACVDPASDASWCGASGSCEGDEAGEVCPAGASCVAGACACPEGEGLCEGACTPPAGLGASCDDDLCCSAGLVCAAGACACGSGLEPCDGACVDTTSSADHCGGCGAPCDPGHACIDEACVGITFMGALPDTPAKWNYQNEVGLPGAIAFCDTNWAGSTVCTDVHLAWLSPGGTMAGATDLDGETVTSFWSVSPDPADFPDGEEEWNPSCDGWAHETGDIGPGGAWRPLDNATGTIGPLEMTSCSNSRWVGCCLVGGEPPACPVGLVECAGDCIDPQTDGAFCGASDGCEGEAAGVACGDGAACVDGLCEPLCEADEELCGDACVDLDASVQHCGDCDDPCDEGQGCFGGECAHVSYAGALPPTTAKWNYENVIGKAGAEAFCGTSFSGATLCEDAHLVFLGPGGTMAGAEDTQGVAVQSFWAVGADASGLLGEAPPPPDASWNPDCDEWAHGTGDIGAGGTFRTLDGGTGAVGDLDMGHCNDERWVSCCHVGEAPPPPAGPIYMGALPQTWGKWNFQNEIGYGGAVSFCDLHFAGSTVCNDADLVALGSGGSMAEAEDLDGVAVTSFWAVNIDLADVPPGKEDLDHACEDWAHGTGDLGPGGAYRPLDGETGAVGALDIGSCVDSRWVGCCVPAD